MYSCCAPIKIRFKALKYNYEFNFKSAEHIVQSKKCLTCSLETVSRLIFFRHSCLKIFACTQCNSVLKSKKGLQQHTRRQHKLLLKNSIATKQPTELKCNYCEKAFVSKYNLTLHTKNKHLVVPKNEWLHCERCDFTAPYKHQLLKHNITHRADKLQCAFCHYKCSIPFFMKEHLIQKHTKDDDIEWFNCEHCDYRAKMKSYLKRYIRNKHEDTLQGAKTFKCNTCGGMFKDNGQLNWHIKIRHSSLEHQSWYQCEHCDYKSMYKSNLRYHIITVHKGTNAGSQRGACDGWHQCEHCDFKAQYKTLVKHHVNKTHQSVGTWYKCELCSHKSRFKSALKNHILLKHTKDEDIKWYACNHCEYKAKLEAFLKSHIKHRHERTQNKDI